MSDPNCIFCKIISKEIPSKIHFEDDHCICIEDIHPQARHHLLLIPKQHVADLAQGSQLPDGEKFLGRLMVAATRVASQKGFLPQGFRTVINTGPAGGQTVFHLHIHLLGGENLSGQFA